MWRDCDLEDGRWISDCAWITVTITLHRMHGSSSLVADPKKITLGVPILAITPPFFFKKKNPIPMANFGRIFENSIQMSSIIHEGRIANTVPEVLFRAQFSP